ncbi:MAG TPA: radical SAM protein [Verrucomicrobiales bacterium]|nr:radical SAM protein [Verrucomicrobiales bacterium]
MSSLSPASPATLLKTTKSRCPVCHRACPAVVWRREGRVEMDRTCPEHGPHTACLASDSRFYWLAKGAREAEGACCGGGACCDALGSPAGTLGRNAAERGPDTFETLSTCLALIEIVHSCNLACPTCYADSPPGAGAHVDAVPLADLQARIDGVVARKGGIEILQLSGGEPTLHPDLIELCRWAREHPGIDFLLLNTNGVRLAREPALCQALGDIFATGGLQVYLQFDGRQESGQKRLRGADLRALRETALENLAAAGIPVTLAMTVTEENLPHLWEAIAYGLDREGIHGITFQPEFRSGRSPGGERRLNTGDILTGAVEQSGGSLGFADFTPLPCGDPNCATIGYLIRQGKQVWPVSDFLDFTELQGFLKDKIHYTLEDLARCGCDNEPLGDLLKTLERTRSMAFRIMVKPFMDAGTWDEDRLDRCCTHVIRPDGALDSFCRYYSGFADTR